MSHFDEYMLYKTLAFKFQSNNQQVMDLILDNEKELEKVRKQVALKNISTVLPESFFNELDALLQDLEISKRKFVELAIYDGYERLKKVVAEHDIYRDYPPDFDDETPDDEAT